VGVVVDQCFGAERLVQDLSANERRRHMNKGQRAMVAAKIDVKAGNNSPASNRLLAKQTGVDRRYVDHAAMVLEYAPDLAGPQGFWGRLSMPFYQLAHEKAVCGGCGALPRGCGY
jgi:hypothetical protein